MLKKGHDNIEIHYYKDFNKKLNSCAKDISNLASSEKNNHYANDISKLRDIYGSLVKKLNMSFGNKELQRSNTRTDLYGGITELTDKLSALRRTIEKESSESDKPDMKHHKSGTIIHQENSEKIQGFQYPNLSAPVSEKSPLKKQSNPSPVHHSQEIIDDPNDAEIEPKISGSKVKHPVNSPDVNKLEYNNLLKRCDELEKKIKILEVNYSNKEKEYKKSKDNLNNLFSEKIPDLVKKLVSEELRKNRSGSTALSTPNIASLETLRTEAQENLQNLNISPEFLTKLDGVSDVFKKLGVPFEFAKVQPLIDLKSKSLKYVVDKVKLKELSKLTIDWPEYFLSMVNTLSDKILVDEKDLDTLKVLGKELGLNLILPGKGEKYQPKIHSPYSEEKSEFERGFVVQLKEPGVFDKKNDDVIQKAKVIVSK